MLALKADIDSNRQAGRITAQSAGSAASTAPMIQGMENAGIDVARMQRDPAYQKEMQQRIQQMSPQEQMAFMNKMMQPHMQASTKDVKAMGQESPAIQAAAEAARTFPQRQSAWLTGPRQSFIEDFELVLQRVTQKPFGLEKPKIEYDSIGCDNACLAQWKIYGDKLWPLVLARETDILQGRRAVLQRYKAAASGMIKEGDTHLTASRFGNAAGSQVNRGSIALYHEGLLGEVSGLIDQTEIAAKRARDIVNGGVEKFFWGGVR
jgi:hypothetical protein